MGHNTGNEIGSSFRIRFVIPKNNTEFYFIFGIENHFHFQNNAPLFKFRNYETYFIFLSTNAMSFITNYDCKDHCVLLQATGFLMRCPRHNLLYI